MGLLCAIGQHKWQGCKCPACNKLRDEQHTWDAADCNICTVCGKVRTDGHNWKNCKCINCAMLKDSDHCWKGSDCNTCTVCGKTRTDGHNWKNCKCAVCGQTKDEDHIWSSADCNRCTSCGKSRSDGHDWEGCKCGKCGQVRSEGHSWKTNDCNLCAVCGARRNDGHLWDNFKCISCGCSISDLYNNGYKFLEQQEFEKAREFFVKIVSIHPYHADTLLCLWAIYYALENKDKAIECYRKIKGAPTTARFAWFLMGKIYMAEQKDIQAADCFLNTLRIKPDDITAWNDLAVICMNKSVIDNSAVQCLLTAISIDPEAVDTWYNLGNVMEGMQKTKDAMICWRKAAELGDDESEELLRKNGYDRNDPALSLSALSFPLVGAADINALLAEMRLKLNIPEENEEKTTVERMVVLNALPKVNGDIIISPSQRSHFKVVVALMDDMRARRLGSQHFRGFDGREYIYDTYVLPDGQKFKAGYAM